MKALRAAWRLGRALARGGMSAVYLLYAVNEVEAFYADAVKAKPEDLESAGKREIAMMVPVVFLVLPVTVVFALFPGFYGISLVAFVLARFSYRFNLTMLGDLKDKVSVFSGFRVHLDGKPKLHVIEPQLRFSAAKGVTRGAHRCATTSASRSRAFRTSSC